MNFRKNFCLLWVVLLCGIWQPINAQDNKLQTTLGVPAVLLQHYTTGDLNAIRSADTLKYKSLLYYYTESFVVEKIDCSDCIETDLRTFDVSKYEYLREKDKRYERVFDKYGFKLTLLSFDELLYTLPAQRAKFY